MSEVVRLCGDRSPVVSPLPLPFLPFPSISVFVFFPLSTAVLSCHRYSPALGSLPGTRVGVAPSQSEPRKFTPRRTDSYLDPTAHLSLSGCGCGYGQERRGACTLFCMRANKHHVNDCVCLHVGIVCTALHRGGSTTCTCPSCTARRRVHPQNTCGVSRRQRNLIDLCSLAPREYKYRLRAPALDISLAIPLYNR